jgi:serine phosphatase RsbU (regulator of sigma subunit)
MLVRFFIQICLCLIVVFSFGVENNIDSLISNGYKQRKLRAYDSLHYYANTAISKAKKEALNTSLPKAYKLKGLALQDTNNLKGALKLFFLSKSAAEKINDSSQVAEALNDIGIAYYMQQIYDSAMVYFEQSAVLKVATKDSLGAGRAFNNTGIMHDIAGSPGKAVNSYIKALRIYEEKKDSSLIVGTTLNIGLVYLNQKNYPFAEEEYLKTAKISAFIKDTTSLINSYNSLGIVQDNYKDFDSAFSYFNSALLLSETINHKYYTSLSLTNIATNLSYRDKYAESLAFSLRALALKDELGYKSSMAISHIGIAETYKKLKNPILAIKHAEQALDLAEETNYVEYIKAAKSLLHGLYHERENDIKAYQYLHEYVNLKDSLLNEQNTKIINELNTKYETEKKDKEITLLTKDKEIQAAEIKRKRAIQYATTAGFFLVLILAVVVFNSYRQKKKANEILSYKNVEIERQRDEIAEQKFELTDSIEYAKTLQEAILPPQQEIQKTLPNHFVLFKPKDIVSGDFYWFAEQDGKSFIAAIDCTGHGVPGAFVSMIGYNLLNQIVLEKGTSEPSKILSKLSLEVKNAFSRKGSLAGRNDGMDLSLCVIDHKKNTMAFSGAKNPLYFMRNNELHIIKGDSAAIGGITEDSHVFEEHQISIEPADIFYIFSDGYQDQFGGEKGKKFMTKKFKLLLTEIHKTPLEKQEDILNLKLIDWQGNLDQVDDICIIGFSV